MESDYIDISNDLSCNPIVCCSLEPRGQPIGVFQLLKVEIASI